jgi:hypothetical protein
MASGWIAGALHQLSILLLLALKLLLLHLRHLLLERDQDRERIYIIGFNPEPPQAIVLIHFVQQVFLIKGCPGLCGLAVLCHGAITSDGGLLDCSAFNCQHDAPASAVLHRGIACRHWNQRWECRAPPAEHAAQPPHNFCGGLVAMPANQARDLNSRVAQGHRGRREKSFERYAKQCFLRTATVLHSGSPLPCRPNSMQKSLRFCIRFILRIEIQSRLNR